MGLDGFQLTVVNTGMELRSLRDNVTPESMQIVMDLVTRSHVAMVTIKGEMLDQLQSVHGTMLDMDKCWSVDGQMKFLSEDVEAERIKVKP